MELLMLISSLPVMTRCNRMIYVKLLLVRAFVCINCVAYLTQRNLRNEGISNELIQVRGGGQLLLSSILNNLF